MINREKEDYDDDDDDGKKMYYKNLAFLAFLLCFYTLISALWNN